MKVWWSYSPNDITSNMKKIEIGHGIHIAKNFGVEGEQDRHKNSHNNANQQLCLLAQLCY